MRTHRLLVLALLLNISSLNLVSQSEQPKATIETKHTVVADSSSLASATISAGHGVFKAGASIKIHLVLQNRSDHNIGLLPPSRTAPSLVFDVRDNRGALVPETHHGCEIHYFSSCYQPEELHRGVIIGSPAPASAVIAAHTKSATDVLLNAEYNLSVPGTYTVVGYEHILDENGNDAGTFKTNTISITVQ